jgi:hypothetical protein
MTHTLRGPVWATLLVLSFGTGALAQRKQVWGPNDSGGSSNRTVSAVGMVANLYF